MSARHLNTGKFIEALKLLCHLNRFSDLRLDDEFPSLPDDDGWLRLLSMRFCPYAQRVHLVLDAKRIPHHVINIDLKAKPMWLPHFSPLGKVPALVMVNEPGSPYIYESLLIADYLDEKYPSSTPESDQRLHPADPLSKALDRLWVDRFNAVIKPFFRIAFYGRDDEALAKLLAALDEFEEELQRRGGNGFFADVANGPGMLDLMIWPWMERMYALKQLVFDDAAVADRYEIRGERFPLLVSLPDNICTIDMLTTRFRYIFPRSIGLIECWQNRPSRRPALAQIFTPSTTN